MARQTPRSAADRWARQRPFLLDLCRAWKADLETRVPARTVVVELHPESAPTSGWNWFLSFAIDDAEFDAFVAADLSTAAFEDVRGVFEAHVKLEDIPAYLARRLKAAG